MQVVISSGFCCGCNLKVFSNFYISFSLLLLSVSILPYCRQYIILLLCRLRKGDRKLFESSQSLEKTYNKCSDRLKQCQKKTTVARNEYLLSLASTNAHLHRHATEDLPCLMRVRVRVSTQRSMCSRALPYEGTCECLHNDPCVVVPCLMRVRVSVYTTIHV